MSYYDPINNNQKKQPLLSQPNWAGIGGIVAILGLVCTIFFGFVPHPDGLFGSPNSGTPVNTATATSSSSIPILHSSYGGTFTDTTLGTHGQLTIWEGSEDTTTGTFTGTGTSETAGGPTCFFQVTNGLITADGKMTWTIDYGQSSSCTGTANATGQLNNGMITGSWTNTSIQDAGNFTLS